MIDSRSIRDGIATRRRRECLSCGHRYTTYEYIEADEVRVIKRDKRVEPYSRLKLRSGILSAFAKRPFTDQQIDTLVERIEAQITAIGTEVNARAIGEIVMRELASIDEVAYIRFASVYKRFTETVDFREELDKLRNPGEAK